MKGLMLLAALVVAAIGTASLLGTNSASAATCTPTRLVRDGINLTAAVIDPATPVTGTLDATGCNIGVYYGPGTTGTVTGTTTGDSEIFGANYYGVVVNAATVLSSTRRFTTSARTR